MEFIFVFIILAITLFLFLQNKNNSVKNPVIKKEEIYTQYKKQLQSLLEKYKDNKTVQIEQKKIFLQNCNSELSRNIFFTQEESIQMLQKLSRL